MLYTTQLVNFVKNHPHLHKYFLGVYSRDYLPILAISQNAAPLGFIVNTDTGNLPGTHWIACVLLPSGQGEVFDSFAQIPPSSLQLWMNKHCPRGWFYNTTCIQGPLTTLCGGYCLFYLYHRLVSNMSMQTIISILSNSCNSDCVIQTFLKKHSHIL